MENLRNCPFCGGEAQISADTEAVRDSEGRLWAYTVVCRKCCATSGLTYSPDRAMKAWNNRATEAELRASVIDEFAEAIMVKATELSEKAIFDGKLVGDALSLDCVSDMVLEIALQMKGEKE